MQRMIEAEAALEDGEQAKPYAGGHAYSSSRGHASSPVLMQG
jgi:hypothetical protein